MVHFYISCIGTKQNHLKNIYRQRNKRKTDELAKQSSLRNIQPNTLINWYNHGDISYEAKITTKKLLKATSNSPNKIVQNIITFSA